MTFFVSWIIPIIFYFLGYTTMQLTDIWYMNLATGLLFVVGASIQTIAMLNMEDD